MARYEVADGRAHKFWEILLEGPTYRIRFGRIGTRGQEKVKLFESTTDARLAHDKIIREKLAKGYVLVDGAPPTERPVEIVDHVDPALEARIIERPNDLDAYAVYADWLQQQGDPRGELMGVGVAMKRERDATRFLALKQALAPLEAIKPALLGQALVARGDLVRLVWELGLVRKATITAGEESGALLETLAARPVGRLIREVTLRGHEAGRALYVITSGATPALRVLEIDAPHNLPIFYGRGWTAVPHLEIVRQNGENHLGVPDAPRLSELRVSASWNGTVQSIVQGRLPALKVLELVSDGDISLDVAPLAGADLPALRSLAIRCTGGAYGPLVRALADSPIGPRLEELILVGAALDEDAAQALIAARPRLASVTHLQVEGARAADVRRAYQR